MSDELSERYRPYAMAQDCRATAARLDAEIATAATKAEAKALRRRRKLVNDLARWCETRAGYVVPDEVQS